MQYKFINWGDISENIIAGAIVAFFFGIFFQWLINWRNRPKLKLIINMEDPPAGTSNHWISVHVANYGEKGFDSNDVVWHVYWPHSLVGGYFIDQKGSRLPKEVRSFVKRGESNIHGNRHSHFSCIVGIPIAPGKEVTILYFKLPRELRKEDLVIPYQFSTKSYGAIPKRVRTGLWWKKVDDREGFPALELLPLARVRDIRQSNHRGTSFIPPEEMSNEWFE